jgi:hypothetical protein
MQPQLIDALGKLDYAKLLPISASRCLRAWELAFTRMGKPSAGRLQIVAASSIRFFPDADRMANRELVSLLVFVDLRASLPRPSRC